MVCCTHPNTSRKHTHPGCSQKHVFVYTHVQLCAHTQSNNPTASTPQLTLNPLKCLFCGGMLGMKPARTLTAPFTTVPSFILVVDVLSRHLDRTKCRCHVFFSFSHQCFSVKDIIIVKQQRCCCNFTKVDTLKIFQASPVNITDSTSDSQLERPRRNAKNANSPSVYRPSIHTPHMPL